MSSIFWRDRHLATTTYQEILGLDCRSLALFRIVFSCWFIAHLITRSIKFSSSFDFRDLFTTLSVAQLLNSEYFLVYILFALSLLFAVLLLIGHQTTWSSIAFKQARDNLTIKSM